MPPTEQNVLPRLLLTRLVYPFMVVLSFYLLFMSRSGEVHTVWEVLHPAFIPVFFAATSLLLATIFSSEKLGYKLLLIIIHSILCHTFFVIIFPAGNVGVQQVMLGQSRLVFDNIMPHGFGLTEETTLLSIYILFRGENLQTAFSVIFARMFGVDLYWSHLLLVPLLWGIFVPIIAFMISKTVGASEKISVLSSLLVSLFPANIIWGAASISNGLGYLFFFCFIYFVLKYIESNKAKNLFLVAIFFFVSFLSHYLAGTMALSLLILANSVKTYQKDKARSPVSAKSMLTLAFIFCASILPFVLAYRRFFYPWANTHFSLQKLYEQPPIEMVLSLVFGGYLDFISREAYITTLIFGIATLLGIIGMAYILRRGLKKVPKRSVNPSVLFLFLGLLMVIGDDRIIKYFMMNVPFFEIERLWLFRDFILVPFVAIFIGAAMHKMRAFLDLLCKNIKMLLLKIPTHTLSKKSSFLTRISSLKRITLGSILTYVALLTIVSGWITLSVYYAYPHWGPLQTTSYELEAVKYIQTTTNETYIVICDVWITYAGGMITGISNPQAYYFYYTDPRGISLFVEMKNNPTNETMKEAMKTNNAKTAYFIIEEPRLGTDEYNSVIQTAQQNNLQNYKTFHYEGIEKLHIFYYRRE